MPSNVTAGQGRTTVPRPKRSNGEGSYFQDKRTGRFRIEVTTGDPDNPRLYARADTKAEAIVKLRELQARVGSGAPVGSTATLAEWLDYWLEVQGAAVARGEKDWKTLDNYRWAVTRLKETALATTTLRYLEPEHVEQVLLRMANAGMARGTVVRVKTVLGQALDFALSRRKVSWNVAKVAEMPGNAPAPAQGKSLDEEQFKRLWSVSREWPLQHAFLVTGWQLGLRPGELLSLAWTEVDLPHVGLEGGVVTVAFRLDRGGKQRGGGTIRRVRGPKTGSERRVVMPPETAQALAAWRTEQAAQASALGEAWDNPENVVFSSEVGGLIHPSNMDRRLAIVLKAAGIEGRWSMTDLGRRTSASVLSANEMQLEDIAVQFGHANTRMLEQHYRKQLRPADRHLAVWKTIAPGSEAVGK